MSHSDEILKLKSKGYEYYCEVTRLTQEQQRAEARKAQCVRALQEIEKQIADIEAQEKRNPDRAECPAR